VVRKDLLPGTCTSNPRDECSHAWSRRQKNCLNVRGESQSFNYPMMTSEGVRTGVVMGEKLQTKIIRIFQQTVNVCVQEVKGGLSLYRLGQ